MHVNAKCELLLITDEQSKADWWASLTQIKINIPQEKIWVVRLRHAYPDSCTVFQKLGHSHLLKYLLASDSSKKEGVK